MAENEERLKSEKSALQVTQKHTQMCTLAHTLAHEYAYRTHRHTGRRVDG